MSNNDNNHEGSIPPHLAAFFKSREMSQRHHEGFGNSVAGVATDLHNDANKVMEMINGNDMLGPAAIGHFTRSFSEIIGAHSRYSNCMTADYLNGFEGSSEDASLAGHFIMRNWLGVNPNEYGNITVDADIETSLIGLLGLLSATRATLFLQLRKVYQLASSTIDSIRDYTGGDLTKTPQEAFEGVMNHARHTVMLLQFMDHLGLSISDEEMEKMRVVEGLELLRSFGAECRRAMEESANQGEQ